MSVALRDAQVELGEVAAVEHLGGGMVEISLRLPALSATAHPGQFAQIRCGETSRPLLRRPFSVAWIEGDLAAFVLAPVGEGTRMLAALRPGDCVSVLGPLGHGFTADPHTTSSLCVAGGLGCAPFPLLVAHLRRSGQRVTVLNGAATAARLYPPERFSRGDHLVEVIQFTIDGSQGTAGSVTAAVADHLQNGMAVYGCGPNAMLAALATAVHGGDAVPALAQVSLEAPMGCGYGTCLGCALPVRALRGGAAWALCCREGPVMDMRAVAWEELLQLPPAHVA